MQKQNLTKDELAKRTRTGRSALNRLLDPGQPSNLKSYLEYREPFKMVKDTSFLEKCPEMCPVRTALELLGTSIGAA